MCVFVGFFSVCISWGFLVWVLFKERKGMELGQWGGEEALRGPGLSHIIQEKNVFKLGIKKYKTKHIKWSFKKRFLKLTFHTGSDL